MIGLGKMARWRRARREESGVRLDNGEEGRQFNARFPGLNLDGQRHWAGMPPPVPGVCPEAKGSRRRAPTGPGEAQKREFAEVPIKVAQTQWHAWHEWDRMRSDQTQSNPIKVAARRLSTFYEIEIAIMIKEQEGGRWNAVGDEARPHLVPPHEPPLRKGPPLPDPLLHKCVEEREMKRCARVHGFNARSFSGNSLHEHKAKREPPRPDPLLHKCMEEREMERSARVLGINARNSSANSLPQERERTDAAPGQSNQIKPNQTFGGGGARETGQGLVAGGWWRKRAAESSLVKPGQTQSNRSGSRRRSTLPTVKPSQTQSNQSSRLGSRRRSILPTVKPSQTQSNQFIHSRIIRDMLANSPKRCIRLERGMPSAGRRRPRSGRPRSPKVR
jgi:hypothetical protein